ncbi:ABC transporter permease [Porphyromonadaceae bacterium W3.11]|nr:ABC transporter permease [Porphyromonadaceae bacterium W3.11]
MIKQYFKQAWRILRENPVLSIITILGTALSICMIMVQVMTENVKYGHLPPETKRDRMLIIKRASVKTTTQSTSEPDQDGSTKTITTTNTNTGPLGYQLISKVFVPMKTPEAIGFFQYEYSEAKLTDSDEALDVLAFLCNSEYWKCFEFRFLTGSAFTNSDVESMAKKAVLSKAFALKLFGSADVLGRRFYIHKGEEFEVCGVVETPSSLATYAQASMWIPHTSTSLISQEDRDEISGGFSVILLAKSKRNFKDIRNEVKEKLDEFLSHTPNTEVNIYSQPDTYRESKLRRSDQEPKTKAMYRRIFALLLLFLVVPAINLSLMTNSRMNRRAHEIGVRRAYGATTHNILWQVIWESLLFTIIGSIFGFLLSIWGVFGLSKILFKGYNFGELNISLWNLLQPRVLILAILFCLLLNLISAIVPAIRYARSNIIQNLYDE